MARRGGSGFDWTVPGRVARAVALRDGGKLHWHSVAKLLSQEWGVEIHEGQVRNACKWHGRSAPPQATPERRVSGPTTRALHDLVGAGMDTGSLGQEKSRGQAILDALAKRCPPPPPPEAFLDQQTPIVKETLLVEEEDVLHTEAIVAAPAIHTSRTRAESYLVISDTQEPYSAPGAIAFCLAVAKEEGIDVTQPGSVYHDGDEADLYAFSKFLHSPEAPHTPRQELEILRERMRAWYRAFPFVKVCNSNHQQRIIRRAAEAGLPAQALVVWRDLIEAAAGWEWADSWHVKASKQPFLVEHGHHGGQSVNALRIRALSHGCSVVFGHQVQAQVIPVRTHRQSLWSMCIGALIDREAIAFEYGKPLAWQPCLGVGVVRDGGRMPVWYPYGGDYP